MFGQLRAFLLADIRRQLNRLLYASHPPQKTLAVAAWLVPPSDILVPPSDILVPLPSVLFSRFCCWIIEPSAIPMSVQRKAPPSTLSKGTSSELVTNAATTPSIAVSNIRRCSWSARGYARPQS